MPSQEAPNLVFGDEAVQRLAQQLRETASIDPEELLSRLSEGENTPLPEFHVGSADMKLQPWQSVERASPTALTDVQYERFLQGKPVSPSISETLAYYEQYLAIYTDSFLRESRRMWIAPTTLLLASAAVGLWSAFEPFSSTWLSLLPPILTAVTGFLSARILEKFSFSGRQKREAQNVLDSLKSAIRFNTNHH